MDSYTHATNRHMQNIRSKHIYKPSVIKKIACSTGTAEGYSYFLLSAWFLR